jgi:hypothetical protein
VLACQIHEEFIDTFLRMRQAGGLADVDHARARPDELKDLGRDESVMNHNVRFFQQPRRAKRQELRITWPGTNEMDGHASRDRT